MLACLIEVTTKTDFTVYVLAGIDMKGYWLTQTCKK